MNLFKSKRQKTLDKYFYAMECFYNCLKDIEAKGKKTAHKRYATTIKLYPTVWNHLRFYIQKLDYITDSINVRYNLRTGYFYEVNTYLGKIKVIKKWS